ncbi:putative catechol 1,2-dioxygenase [Patellaria atrata CBS 101060]|uniref:Catechol 1,2-dioxygenase n=1 Tax=Patellaria atrata CBS 101060 TaxID=1346257 RepID=A0A9P4VSD2_9PEZI|nr:putative catechol 1,2-dioxygenase [Patellaria atrata CBS 101060]
MAASQSRFDPKFTEHVLSIIGPNTPPRTRTVMSALIRHIHDFAREVELTTEEWMMGVHFINSLGQISDSKRNETHRICDVIGLESLVDEIAHKHALETEEVPTSSSILGPFWSPNAPWRNLGDSIIQDPHQGQVSLFRGKVLDLVTGKGISNAVVDIWQASSNGKYDFQDPENQTDNNLRGKFKTDEDGNYWFYCLKPTAYSLPTDGPAGVLLNLLDRHAWRPAHIHMMISHGDYKPVTTQLYPDDDPNLETDTVFAVKDDLIIHFDPLEGDSNAELKLEYNFKLAPKGKPPVERAQL